MRRTLLRLNVVRAALLVCAGIFLLPAAARGYVLAGPSWPTHTITYYDAGPNPAAVREAVHAWNTSGAHVRFVATSRARARVVIDVLRPRGCLGLEGVATLGYDPFGDAVHLRSCADRYEAAIVAAHELGHVLGLAHETHVCATMNPSAGQLCGTSPPYYTQCRILQIDDVRGAVKRYGGHVRPIRSPQFCPEFSAPVRPASVIVAGAAPPAEELTATVRVRAEQPLVTVPAFRLGGLTFKQSPPHETVDVYRYANACRTGRPSGHPDYVQDVPASGRAQVYLDERVALPPGQWCYAVWITDSAGRRSAQATTATVTVTHQPPSASFPAPTGAVAGYATEFDDASVPGDDPLISWSWSFGDGTTATGQTATHTYGQPGTYTVTLTVTASDGQTSTTSAQVTVAPQDSGY